METVSLATSAGYDLPALREAVIRLLEPIGGISKFINCGERVLLKPNMLAAKIRTWQSPHILPWYRSLPSLSERRVVSY